MRYRRSIVAGGSYFFTANLAVRSQDTDVFRAVRTRHPFDIIAMVVSPDHLHTIWQLPLNDADYPLRWSLIKSGFSRSLPKVERIRDSRCLKRERGIWQRRYWEHQIRDDRDLQTHVDYIHYNPVKHGHAANPVDWPHSSIHRHIASGTLSSHWAKGVPNDGGFGEWVEGCWASRTQPNLRELKSSSPLVVSVATSSVCPCAEGHWPPFSRSLACSPYP